MARAVKSSLQNDTGSRALCYTTGKSRTRTPAHTRISRPLLTLTGLAPQSCIFFSASAGVMLQFVKKAIRVSATKQLNEVGIHRFSAGSSEKKHCKI